VHTDILWVAPTLSLLLGYLLGSIPFGVLLTRIAGAGDLRQIGSGNIGATNVLRTGRKGLAAATLLLDLAKGAAAVLIARAIWPGLDAAISTGAGVGWLGDARTVADAGAIAGLGAVIGHCYPLWLKFRGGKGVATLMGVVAALAWPLGLIFAVVWLGMLLATRISSLGGMSAAVSAPVAAAVLGYRALLPVLVALALLVLWRHRGNIARLLRGEEPRVGAKG